MKEDVTLLRAKERMNKINLVRDMIKKANDSGRDIDWDVLEVYVAERLGCAVRTAKEYVKVARIKEDEA